MHQIFGTDEATDKKTATYIMQTKTIARLIKKGFNPNDAAEMVEKYFDLATRRGCITPSQYANAVSSFWVA